MTQKWWKNSVVYQIYPRSFNDSNGDGIGDIPGITEKLDYLAELGIDVIWLSPVYVSPNDDNGYDISDYQEIMPEFGTMADFDRLLTEAHLRNIRIMMDVVVNHSSDEHSWFIESRSSKDNDKRDYYIWRPGKADGTPPNNWGAAFGGSAWQYDEKTDEYYLHLFSPKQPDLNWEYPPLREKVYKMMNFWLEKGVDGFRLDVINFISKANGLPDGPNGDGSVHFMNGPRIHEFLQEMNQRTFSSYSTITVGEMPGVTVEEAKKYTGKDREELDMVFHFEHVGLGDGAYGKWSPGNWSLVQLKEIFNKWEVGLEHDGWNSLYWSNHDQPRALSRWIKGNVTSGNHKRAAKMLATCLHFMKGTPYIYQGEEIGMTNVEFQNISQYRDIETLNAYRDLVETRKLSQEEFYQATYERSRDNARTPMQWNENTHAGFTTGTPWIDVNPNYAVINAQKDVENPHGIFHYYKQLIALRKELSIIVEGSFLLIYPDHPSVFAYKRMFKGEELLVLCNFSDENQPLRLEQEYYQKAEYIIGNTYAKSLEPLVVLEPYEAIVYHLKK
ncbi:glucohydrolase [Priestia megaterium]|nr:glucohydrolase [Priestia megaterium]